MCDELKQQPFEFTTPGWYARTGDEPRWVVGMTRHGESVVDYDNGSIAIRENTLFTGPCLGTDPEHPPTPLAMKAMTWYETRGGGFAAVTHKLDGDWLGCVVSSDGSKPVFSKWSDRGECRYVYQSSNGIFREHTGRLPWEKPCSP